MGGVRPTASENGQISPSTTVRAARTDGSRPNLASVLQEGPKNTSIHASTGAIWGIPDKIWLIRHLEASGMSKHVRVNWKTNPRGFTKPCGHFPKSRSREK
jgi:hypothetical protein